MPSIISGILKMIYAKRLKVVPVTFIARLSVGLTYVTIISIIINFKYRFYLLISTVILVYLAMIGYALKALSLPKKSAVKSRKAAIA